MPDIKALYFPALNPLCVRTRCSTFSLKTLNSVPGADCGLLLPKREGAWGLALPTSRLQSLKLIRDDINFDVAEAQRKRGSSRRYVATFTHTASSALRQSR